MASSRVGTRISAAMPGVFCLCSCSIIGIRNASVLPVPVWAVARTSLPSRACGIAAACTGVIVVNFAADSRVCNWAEIGSSVNCVIHLLSCLAEALVARTRLAGQQIGVSQLVLNYADNVRRGNRL